jgi:hypothetical protein
VRAPEELRSQVHEILKKIHHAALVIYETQKEKISLLVASTKCAAIAGGDEVRSASLLFHYFSREEFKVITWSNHGLSNGLVSSQRKKRAARKRALSSTFLFREYEGVIRVLYIGTRK